MVDYTLFLRIGAGPPEPSPDLPATQVVSFGAKTRVGCGGHPLNYTGVGTLAITGGNTANHWRIDERNHLVPRTPTSTTYRAVGPAFSGPYSLTVTDGEATGTVTINIIANAAHVREMAGTAEGGNCPAALADSAAMTQLRAMFGGADSARLALGDTVIGRTGFMNRLNARFFLGYPSGGYAAGNGQPIVITSEEVNSGFDADGNALRGGGFQIGHHQMSSPDLMLLPVQFRNVSFYTNAPAPTTNAFITYQTTAYGLSFYECDFRCGPAVPANRVTSLFPLAGRGPWTVQDCYFYNTGTAISTNAELTGVGNVFKGMKGDAFQMAGGNHYIANNLGFDFAPDAGAHPDSVQMNVDLTGTILVPVWGTLENNMFLRNRGIATRDDAQGHFGGGQTGNRTNGITNQNNLFYLTARNTINYTYCDGPLVAYNTAISDPRANKVVDPAQIRMEPGIAGAGGTFIGNVVNVMEIASQSGVVVDEGNLSIFISNLQADKDAAWAAYTTMFPNLLSVPEGGLTNRAIINFAFTPANLLQSEGGVVDDATGVCASRLFPAVDGQTVGALNDGTVFSPDDADWVAAHPPAT